MNTKFLGLTTLIVKINFLFAGTTLWQMPVLEASFLRIPLYQITGTVLFMVLASLELKPYFIQHKDAAKAKRGKKSNVEDAGLSFIEI